MSWFEVLKNDRTTYVVEDDIWQEAGGEGMDSMEDLEGKLERKLTPQDFTDDPVNWFPENQYIHDTDEDTRREQYNILRDRLPDTQEKMSQYLQRPVWQPGRRKGKTPDKVKMIEGMTP